MCRARPLSWRQRRSGVRPNVLQKRFSVDDKPILIVMAGDAKVDNHKYKEYFGQKAKMLSQDEVESKNRTRCRGEYARLE